MGLISVFRGHRRAFVVTNSGVRNRASGPVTEFARLQCLPLCGAVLASRFDHVFLGMLGLRAAALGGADFDTLRAALPALLADAFHAYASARRESGGARMRERQEVVLAGWSHQLDGVCVDFHEQRTAKVGFDGFEAPPAGFADPWPEGGIEFDGRADDPAGVIAQASVHAGICRAIWPDLDTGGRFVMAEIDEAGVRVTASAMPAMPDALRFPMVGDGHRAGCAIAPPPGH